MSADLTVAAPTELVCRRGCGYEASVGAVIPHVRRYSPPTECPECGAEVVRP